MTIASIAVLGTCVGGTQNGATCVVRDNTDLCVTGGGTCPGVTQYVTNQPVSVPMRSTIVSGAQMRFDVGFYIAQDGGDAKASGSTCYRDFLHPVSATNNDLNVMGGHGPYFNGRSASRPPTRAATSREAGQTSTTSVR